MSAVSTGTDLYRHILDVMPTPIFLVDRDLKILEHNAAARDLLAVPAEETSVQWGGHVLQCLNAVHRHEGCGRTPYCAKCGLRNALKSATRSERVVHPRATLRLVENGRERDRVFRITVAPFEHAGEGRWLLIMDDRTDQAELESLFPLCSSCLEPRTNLTLRKRAEDYLVRHWDGDPAACLCEDCRGRLLGQDPDPEPTA